MRRTARRPGTFERFYYAKVGLGEGCGCAERIIDVHEVERLARRPGRAVRPVFKPLWSRLRHALRRCP